MSSTIWKVVALVVGTAVIGVLLGFYIGTYLTAQPPTVDYTSAAAKIKGHKAVSVTLQTVASTGHAPHPDWVSYYARNPQGKWIHSTVLKVPAYTYVHMTVYQFDTATGLRNPLFGQPRGTLGGIMRVNGKPLKVLNPDLASHTFAVPDLGLTVPLKGVADNAPNQCSVAPCTLKEAHTTIIFTFFSGAPGKHRWQCFVPCAFAFLLGFGGPMQTVGYMDGWLEVA